MPDTLIGQTIGNYRIVSEIGRGGMATVYKAHQTSLNRYVAIKVLPPYFQHTKEFLARFKQEALSAAKLQHPNIVQIYETGEWNGYHFIVMEYVDGESLQSLMQRRGGPLDLPTALNLLAQIGSALDYAHSQGVVHRDVKPSNILIDRQGRALLTDFGIAKAAESTRLTQTGASIGTPEYMAPEQAEGEPVDARSDLYSLGVILFQMLTGYVPFTGATPTAIMFGHVHKAPPSPRSINVALTPAIESVVLKGLAKRKEDRFQSASELVNALRAAQQGKATVFAPTVPAYPIQMPSPVNGRRGMPNWIAPVAAGTIIGLALICGLIGLALVVRSGSPTPTTIAVNPAGARSPLVLGSAATPTLLPPTVTLVPLSPTATSTQVPTAAPPTNAPTIQPSSTPQPTDTAVPPTPTPSGPPGMVFVPAGVFWMGASETDSQAAADEKPGHFVDASAFYIDRFEVTNAQWKQCVDAGRCPKPNGVYSQQSPHMAYGNPTYDNFPVVFISQGVASDYCVWRGEQRGEKWRLPYEYEWEKAARGTDKRIYPWGDTWDGYRANAAQGKPGPLAADTYSNPADAKTYGCSPFGVCNMVGNVREWVADFYGSHWYFDSMRDGPASGILQDPINWSTPPKFVIRGGSFKSSAFDARVSKRDARNGADTIDDVGFRCVKSAK